MMMYKMLTKLRSLTDLKTFAQRYNGIYKENTIAFPSKCICFIPRTIALFKSLCAEQIVTSYISHKKTIITHPEA